MKKYLERLPKEIKDLVYLARDIATRENICAYLVGGFVRDLILGVKNFDLDILVEGDGIAFAEKLSRPLKARLVCHKRFKTATIVLGRGPKIDIASARKESYPHPAKLPCVTKGNLKNDLWRRDFSINAMAISINTADFGKLIDIHRGCDDLRHKNIRILHDLSFIDDPTRILRAVRFKERYNFKIEPRTLKFLKEAVKLKMLERVEPQRTRDELIPILKERQPLKEIISMRKLIGFSFISPRLSLPKKNLEFLRSIEQQVDYFKESHPQRRPLDSWLMFFIGIIDSLDIKQAMHVCSRLALRKGDVKRISAYKKVTRKFILKLACEKIKPSQVYALLEPLSYEVILLLKAKYKNRRIQRHIEDFLTVYNGMRIHLGGHDLKRMGLEPGPAYKKIFKKILNAKLDGLVRTKEEEVALIKGRKSYK
ncbi:MAG: hypothetical protein PHT41_07925 [Candidatus Omnitrophica bacterium]|nr:hypothetical protein [Candidatus Omnitrophota bacterium]MDD5237791.1 hypothetical protein [Candidatus Omnitrophota bacterium]